MVHLKNILLLLSIVCSSAAPKPSKLIGDGAMHNDKRLAARVVLEYKGRVTGAESMGMAAEVTIDTLVGVRYELTLTRGGSVFSHIAIFYKFTSPYQTILYNFITHKSHVNKEGGSPDSEPKVDVIGKEGVGAYACTHLQHGAGTNEISDYWMSTQIPGFAELSHSLNNITAGLSGLAFNGTIFRWGGLVQWKIIETDPKLGQVNMDLQLVNARINIPLPLNTFDVPSN